MHHFSRNEIHSTALFPSLPHFFESGEGLGTSITRMRSGRHALGGANTQLRRSSLKDTPLHEKGVASRLQEVLVQFILHSALCCCGVAPPPYIASTMCLSSLVWPAPIPFPRCGIGAGHARLVSIFHDEWFQDNKQGRLGNKNSSLDPSTRPSANPVTLYYISS